MLRTREEVKDEKRCWGRQKVLGMGEDVKDSSRSVHNGIFQIDSKDPPSVAGLELT